MGGITHQSGGGRNLNWGSVHGSGRWAGPTRVGAGPTWGIALDDGQVVQLERGVAAAAGKADDVVFPVVDELGALLNVDVVSAHVENYPDVALVLRIE